MRKFIAVLLLTTSTATHAQNLPAWTPEIINGTDMRCFDFEGSKALKLYENQSQKTSAELDAATKEIEKYKQSIAALSASVTAMTAAQAKTEVLYTTTETQLEAALKAKASAESHSVLGGGIFIVVAGVLGGVAIGALLAKKL